MPTVNERRLRLNDFRFGTNRVWNQFPDIVKNVINTNSFIQAKFLRTSQDAYKHDNLQILKQESYFDINILIKIITKKQLQFSVIAR